MADAVPDSAQPEASLIGQRCGEYDVIRVLGEGGMGHVYEGVQAMIGKRVAIKLLRNEIAYDPEQMRRLLSEARTVNAVRHRGIVDIFGFGKLDDGRQYLVMELLEGVPLDKVIGDSAPLTLDEFLPIVDTALDALSAAHRVGVIHRDLKPSNMFVAVPASGEPYLKLLDFGLAKQATVPHGTTPQTRASMMIGTPTYMAPEQARGEHVGPATDLYAMGVILFELLTGAPPFEAATPFEIVYKHLRELPPRVSERRPDVAHELDVLVSRLLAKDPAERPESAAWVRAQLRSLGGGRLPALVLPPVRREAPAPAEGVDKTHLSQPRPGPDGVRTSQLASPLPSGLAAPPPAAPAPGPPAAAAPAEPAAAVPGVPAPLPSLTSEPRPSMAVPAPAATPSRRSPLALAGALGLGFLLVAGVGLALRQPPEAPPQPPVAVRPPPPAPAPEPAPAPVPPAPEPVAAPPPQKATLTVRSQQPCELTLDGKPAGPAPLAATELEPGQHTIACRNTFGGVSKATVELAAGAALEHEVVFKTGTLAVWVIPFATVSVDGKNLGETPIQPVQLLEGTHRVELKMDARRVVKTVAVKAGQAAKLKVNMDAP